MRIAAIVLAAGEGRRMGGPKALARIGGRRFVEAAAAAFDRSDIAARVVVLGAQAASVARSIQLDAGVRVVVNERYEEGMLTSLWVGLDAAAELDAEGVLVHPVDNPVVQPGTVTAVLEALAAGARIAIPSCGGRRGHPAGFARAAWPMLRAAPLASGARSVLAERPDWVVHVAAGPDCLVDVDTPEELARLASAQAPRR